MSVVSTIIDAIAPPRAEPVPLVNRLEVRLASARAAVGQLRIDFEQATFQHMCEGTAATAENLALSRSSLTDIEAEVDSLVLAVKIAQERAAAEFAAEARRKHVSAQKALAARLTTTRRLAKNISARIGAANADWVALVREMNEIVALWPACAKSEMPHKELISMTFMHQALRTECARLVCIADPVAFTDPRRNRSHFLDVRDSRDAQIPGLYRTAGADSLPSWESRVAQSAASLLKFASESEPPTLRPVGYSAEAHRLPSAVFEPGVTENPERPAALVERPTSDLNVGFEPTPTAAEQVWNNVPGASKPPPWDTSLEGMKAEAKRLANPVDRLPADSYVAETETEPMPSVDDLLGFKPGDQ